VKYRSLLIEIANYLSLKSLLLTMLNRSHVTILLVFYMVTVFVIFRILYIFLDTDENRQF